MFRPRSWLVLACCLALAACRTPKRDFRGGTARGPGRGGQHEGRAACVSTNQPPGAAPVAPSVARQPPGVFQAPAMNTLTHPVTTTPVKAATNVVTVSQGPESQAGDPKGADAKSQSGGISQQSAVTGDQRGSPVQPQPSDARAPGDPAKPKQPADQAAADRPAGNPSADTLQSDAVRQRAPQRIISPVQPVISAGDTTRPDRAHALVLDVPRTATASNREAYIKTSIARTGEERPPVANQPLREALCLPVPEPGIPSSKPAPTSLQIWNGIGNRRLAAKEPAKAHALFALKSFQGGSAGAIAIPLNFQLADATNTPAGTLRPRPLLLDPLFNNDATTASWCQQQIARQTAQQRAREEERNKLKRILYELLLPPKSEQSD